MRCDDGVSNRYVRNVITYYRSQISSEDANHNDRNVSRTGNQHDSPDMYDTMRRHGQHGRHGRAGRMDGNSTAYHVYEGVSGINVYDMRHIEDGFMCDFGGLFGNKYRLVLRTISLYDTRAELGTDARYAIDAYVDDVKHGETLAEIMTLTYEMPYALDAPEFDAALRAMENLIG